MPEYTIEDISEGDEEPFYELKVMLSDEEIEGLRHGSGVSSEFPEPVEPDRINCAYVGAAETSLDMDWVRARNEVF